MAPRQPARIVATGILFEEPADPIALIVERERILQPERRQQIADWRAGELLLLTYAAFADVDAGGGAQRMVNASHGPIAVPTRRSATSTLLDTLSHDDADVLAGLRIAGYEVSRFEYYAAPHTIELHESIRMRLVLD